LPDEIVRRDPPERAPEQETLEAFMDYQRASVFVKVRGLDKEAGTRRIVPSVTTILGVVKHLAYVEAWWFQDIFGGRDLTYPWTDEDPDAEFRVGGDETVESVMDLYASMTSESRAAAAGASLDDLSRKVHPRRGTSFSLRWIYLHMIEETARHLGHLDILRELIDGETGD
jgi:uncharacterized damage-inducible protein DinB